ncbi:MAG TPA: enolase C-terminal domain-like protein [Chloroflexota bacterium]|nr:enolase C-terminal domain-like protein [Chloroflexota bacterium]
MRITEVEIIPIYPRLVARAAAYNAHFPNWNLRTVFRVRAENGLVGYGDYRCPPPDGAVAKLLIGRSPFEFLGNDLNPGLGGALYDLMGKQLDLPAHRLLGQQVRRRVSVAAWTKPVPPETLSAEVQRAVSEGYSIMKMHSSDYYDILEQNGAVEAVAPPGFRMHYDFNHNRGLAAVLPILRQLEGSPVVGFVEDPLRASDVSAWQDLRRRVRIPLIMHPTPLGGFQEAHLGLADAYMSNGQIGLTLRRGGAWEAAGAGGLLQITGGTLTKALAMHLAAVIPACTMHTVNLDDQYEDDITTERIPVAAGTSPVPDGPGLGMEVDEDALARLAATPPTPVPRHVAVLRLADGHTITFPSLTTVNVQAMTGREEGTIRGLRLELWDDDGSPAFQRAHERVQTGPFLSG